MKKYFIWIGALLFACIVWRIGPSEITNTLLKINIAYFLLAFLMLILSSLAKIYRWHQLKKAQKIKSSLMDSFFSGLTAMSLAILTPGQVAEFGKVFYIREAGYPLSKGLINVFLDKIFDLIWLFIFGVLAIFYFFNIFSNITSNHFYSWLFLFFIFLLIIWLILKPKILLFLIGFFLPKNKKEDLISAPGKIWEELKTIRPLSYLYVLLISLFSWLFFVGQMVFLAKAIGLSIPLITIALGTTVARLIAMLPISFSGLGTREGILVLLFSPLTTPQIIVSFSFLGFLNAILFSLLAFLSWFKRPLPLPHRQK